MPGIDCALATMGCAQSLMRKRSSAYRVNESGGAAEDSDALESKRRRSKQQAEALLAAGSTTAEPTHQEGAAEQRGAKQPEVKEDGQKQLAKAGAAKAGAAAKPAAAPGRPAAAAPAARPKLDPKDFMFCGLKGETRVKLPGAVNGQQFIIDNCQDCDLFVMDACASVTIDDCKNCRIFIGPTESSVFIRDCSGCTFAVISRQLRTRDVHDCSLALLCRSRPIVESSSALRVACYSSAYSGLAAQLRQQGMSPFHNFWSHLYDFTPASAAAGEAPHWRLLRGAEGSLQALFPRLPAEVQELMVQCQEACVLRTWGEGQLPEGELAAGEPLFVLLPPGQAQQAVELAARCCAGSGAAAACTAAAGEAAAGEPSSASAAGGAAGGAAASGAPERTSAAGDAAASSVRLLLVRTNEAQLSAGLAGQMAEAAGWDAAALRAAAAVKASMIGLEVSGTAAALEQLQREALALGARCTRSQAAAAMFRHLGIEG